MARDTHPDPICVKLPHDLRIAVQMRAQAEGISVSEYLRALVHQAIYNEMPAVEEGYQKGRNLAARLAHLVIERAAEQLPPTYAEALALLASLER